MIKTFSMDVEQDIQSAVEFGDMLNKYKIKGEFYICGFLVEKYPKECKKIAKTHIIGGHGYNHENFAKLNYNQAKRIILKTKDQFKKNNIEMKGWRFPGLNFKNSQMRILANENIFDSTLRRKDLKRWKHNIHIRHFLSQLKRGYIFTPTSFPHNLVEKPWDIVDLNNIEFYKQEGRFLTHCYNYKNFKTGLNRYLKENYNKQKQYKNKKIQTDRRI